MSFFPNLELIKDNNTHLAAEIDWLLAMLQDLCLQRIQALGDVPQVPGLQISTAEVTFLLNQPLNPLRTENHPPDESEANHLTVGNHWRDQAEHVRQQRQAAVDLGVPLALEELATLTGIDLLEQYLILLAWLPELNPTIGRLYAFLQGDAGQTRPLVYQALSWLSPDLTDIAIRRLLLDPGKPLHTYRLLDALPLVAPLMERQLFVPERVTRFLLEDNRLDPVLVPFCRLDLPTLPGQLESDSDVATRLALAMSSEKDESSFCFLHGPHGSGRQTLARQVCAELGYPLLVADGYYLAQSGEQYLALLANMRREACLQRAALYLQYAERLLVDEAPDKVLIQALLESAAQGSRFVFLAGEKAWYPYGPFNQYNFLSWSCTPPAVPQRLSIWQQTADPKCLAADVNLLEIAHHFRFTAGQIGVAWRAAVNLARFRQPEEPTVGMQDLLDAAYNQSAHHLRQVAQLVPVVYTWDDIVLPKEQMTQLAEIAIRARHLHQVYQDWGFARKLATSRGVVSLFTGPSGTGKTMAANIIARDLGLEMYRVDLSSVVSKYVGETEKNLSRVFDEAWRSNAIIFFDEADALFGKRSEVRDSHDRYANIEINYLLQRLDDFDGIAILATNLGQNIDQAFQRRFHSTIHFPEPEAESRYHIWCKVWPAETPLAPDLDLRFLAERFRLNGGSIRNVALQAAFSAAASGTAVEMRHLLAATMSEIKSSRKLISPADFGPYADLLPRE